MNKPALILPVLLSGCAAFRGPAVIENRFAAVVDQASPAAPVEIAVTTAAAPAGDTGIKITQLGDRAQAALIERSAGKPPIELAAAEHGDGPAGVSLHDTVDRRIVVAVRPVGFLSPGDRVDAIRIKLEVAPPQQGDWRITGWTQATNGQVVIDLGKATDVSSSKLTGSTGINLGSFLPNATVAGEVDRSATREVEIKDTTDFDAAVDDKGHAWLDETAGWRVSLAHNLAISATIAASADRLRPYKLVSTTELTRDDPKNKGLRQPTPTPLVQLHETTVYASLADDRPICGNAELTYRVRHITNAKGRATFSESDDAVSFPTGTSKTSFLLAPAPYLPAYALVTGPYRLSYQMLPAQPVGVLFGTLEAATAFRDWFVQMMPANGRLGNAAVGIGLLGGGLRPLTRAEAGTLVPTVADPDRLARSRQADASSCGPRDAATQ